jgi:hypothetical protein
MIQIKNENGIAKFLKRNISIFLPSGKYPPLIRWIYSHISHNEKVSSEKKYAFVI